MWTLTLLPPANNLSPLKPSTQTRQNYPFSKSIKLPTFDDLHNRLIHQANVGNLHQAISTLDCISHHGFIPNLSVFSLLLKSAIRTRNYKLGKLIHSKLTESGLDLDSVTLNSLISLYSKSGDWRKASDIFEGMEENNRNVVSWSAIISCYAINNMEFKAIEMFVKMLNCGICPNEFCLVGVIKACSNEDWAFIGEIIIGFALKTGNFDDLNVECALIDMYIKGFHNIECAKKVFDKMPERNVVVWTLMITRFVQMGYPEQAIRLFLKMERSGCEPDCFAFTSVISACCELELLLLGKQLHSRVVRCGLMNNASIGACLIEMYGNYGDHNSLSCSRKIFDQILDHSVMSWTAIISAHAQTEGYERKALELYIDMINTVVTPNHFTFASILKACSSFSDSYIGEQVHAQAVTLGFASDNGVANSLVSMYSQLGATEEARKVFDLLLDKNLVSYNTMVDGYVKNQKVEEAFELFHQIKGLKLRPNAFTFSSLLNGVSSIGAGGKGEQIHGRIVKSGLQSNRQILNTLISMYSRCGDIEAAHNVFRNMDDRNIVSWTSMITGFAKHGFARKALDSFDQMIEAGVKPNEITFIAVLSACSHAGLVSEGQRHFDSMYNDYGVVPTMEHYACMVDLLGRSGFLIEARELIESMPFMANSLVWRSFLGACLVHGNTELGENAAKMVRNDPDDPSSYTLLSNFYALKGEWENVKNTRKHMKEKNLNKEAGCSWIETENQIHTFFVGDTTHTRANEIYEKLEKLISEIKEMGYVPNTNIVLHDMEENRKEKYLIQHSEKLAVAYGLISTPRLKPIKIFKNLRICEDCHTAMKYISKATKREIIIRDSNRFHHLKDGLCSCGDFW